MERGRIARGRIGSWSECIEGNELSTVAPLIKVRFVDDGEAMEGQWKGDGEAMERRLRGDGSDAKNLSCWR